MSQITNEQSSDSQFKYSKEKPEKYYGMTIKDAHLNEERLLLIFDNGVKIKVFDDGQDCCEHRYITSDDDPKELIGGKLINICGNVAPDIDDGDGDAHEIVFVEIKTDKFIFTMCNHNEHDGYYGGFSLKVAETEED